ncbi:carbamoyl-phosphate synthase arginine-specific small subunit (chloroplast) [Galdieria partita]|uniref:Carbamoyl phosphate synthase small chain n=1 Tax=Galdieria partita TaxID=83374 RepID=A0A9C7C3D6_9RHOD|nr:carbamoyl-phosphate synthase arginine-specific small subunit [Galdieria partita]
MKLKKKKSILLLADGTIFKGWSYNQNFTCFGEIVFNTGMTGYQEIITDPSYYGQITILTYPEIGNTGFNIEDNESKSIKSYALIIKNFCLFSSNWRMQTSMLDYINHLKLPVLFGFDTRSLAKYIRSKGAMNGCISNEEFDISSLANKLKQKPKMKGLNLIQYLNNTKNYKWNNLGETFLNSHRMYYYANNENKNVNIESEKNKYNLLKICVIDLGTKFNILRNFDRKDCFLKVFKNNINIEDLKYENPDGIVLSNGPGDPLALNNEIQLVKEIIKLNKPILGICMGHQLLNIVFGCKTFKMKFGHRAINHPCGLYLKVKITSQNHGFSVDEISIDKNSIHINNWNFNDNTIAGMSHKILPIFSIQYHPEGAPGPHDTDDIFIKFVNILQSYKSNNILDPTEHIKF